MAWRERSDENCNKIAGCKFAAVRRGGYYTCTIISAQAGAVEPPVNSFASNSFHHNARVETVRRAAKGVARLKEGGREEGKMTAAATGRERVRGRHALFGSSRSRAAHCLSLFTWSSGRGRVRQIEKRPRERERRLTRDNAPRSGHR